MKLLVSFITLLLLGFSQAQRQTLVSSEENDWSLLRALDDGNQQFEPAEADQTLDYLDRSNHRILHQPARLQWNRVHPTKPIGAFSAKRSAIQGEPNRYPVPFGLRLFFKSDRRWSVRLSES